MDCKSFLKILSEFEREELPETLYAEAKKHLDSCTNCSPALKNFQRIILLCKDSMDVEMSLASTLKIKSSIKGLQDKGAKREFGPILNLAELSEYLRVSEDIIEANLNEIPCFELGGHILFRKERIDEWIKMREEKFAFKILESELASESHTGILETTKKGGRRWQL